MMQKPAKNREGEKSGKVGGGTSLEEYTPPCRTRAPTLGWLITSLQNFQNLITVLLLKIKRNYLEK